VDFSERKRGNNNCSGRNPSSTEELKKQDERTTTKALKIKLLKWPVEKREISRGSTPSRPTMYRKKKDAGEGEEGASNGNNDSER